MKNEYSRLFLSYVVLVATGFVAAAENQRVIVTTNNARTANSFELYHVDSYSVPLTEDNRILLNKDGSEVEVKATSLTDNSRNLSKRQATDPFLNKIENPPSSLFPIEKLENCSCEAEASKFGHNHVTAIVIHEMLCELNKLFSYIVFAAENLKPELMHLSLLFNVTEDVVSFTEIIFSDNLPEIVETGIENIEKFVENPSNLKIVIDTIKAAVPIPNIVKSVTRLNIVVKKFFLHIQKLFAYLNINFDFLKVFKELKQRVIVVREKITHLIYGYLVVPVQKIVNVFSKAMGWVELVSDNVVIFVRHKLYQYLAVIEEVIDIVRAVYNGYCASGLPRTLFSILFSANESSEYLSKSLDPVANPPGLPSNPSPGPITIGNNESPLLSKPDPYVPRGLE